MLADPNPNALKNGAFTRTYGAPSRDVWPRFHMDTIEDPVASARQGRPCFKDVERVELNMPGHPYNKPDVLPFLKPAQVKELKALDIMTVEHLAGLNDHGLQRIAMGGRRLKELAESYLDDAKAMALVTEKQAENDRLNAEIAALKLENENNREQMRQVFAELQQLRNAQHPLATAVPAASDPFEMMKMQGMQPQLPEAQSSFADLPAPPPRRRRQAAHTEGDGASW